MEVGVLAQCFQGAAASIHLRSRCSALANELFPVGLSGTLRKNSENLHRKLWEREVEKENWGGKDGAGIEVYIVCKKEEEESEKEW